MEVKRLEAVALRNFHISQNHYTGGTFYRERVTTKQLRSLLLNERDTPIIRGSLCEMKKKNLGAGVWEIWFVLVSNNAESPARCAVRAGVMRWSVTSPAIIGAATGPSSLS